MKVLRWVLGALVLAYGALCVLMAGLNLAHKTGKMGAAPADLQRLIPLWDATPMWQLAIFGVGGLLALMAAWRLFTGGKALGVFFLAVVAEVAAWWFMHKLPAYSTVFTKAELQYDYYTWGALAVVGVLIWLTERGR